MSLTQAVLLPGDTIPPSDVPASKNAKKDKPLTIGPGLSLTKPSNITSTTGGALASDPRKPALWVENNGGRYIPTPGDLVIATVQRSAGDTFLCTLSPYTPGCTIGHLEFEGATRKTRPQLAQNSLVYARVSTAHPNPPHQEATLTCVNSSTGKSDGMGPLKSGTVFEVSLGFARRLLMAGGKGKVGLLEGLAEKGVRFEVAVGRNGYVWVEGAEGDVRSTLVVGRALQVCDGENLTEGEQKGLVDTVVRSLKQ